MSRRLLLSLAVVAAVAALAWLGAGPVAEWVTLHQPSLPARILCGIITPTGIAAACGLVWLGCTSGVGAIRAYLRWLRGGK